MGVDLIRDADGAVMYCTTTRWAFGPVFENEGEAEDFLEWLRKHPGDRTLVGDGTDPRDYSNQDLERRVAAWRSATEEADR